MTGDDERESEPAPSLCVFLQRGWQLRGHAHDQSEGELQRDGGLAASRCI